MPSKRCIHVVGCEAGTTHVAYSLTSLNVKDRNHIRVVQLSYRSLIRVCPGNATGWLPLHHGRRQDLLGRTVPTQGLGQGDAGGGHLWFHFVVTLCFKLHT